MSGFWKNQATRSLIPFFFQKKMGQTTRPRCNIKKGSCTRTLTNGPSRLTWPFLSFFKNIFILVFFKLMLFPNYFLFIFRLISFLSFILFIKPFFKWKLFLALFLLFFNIYIYIYILKNIYLESMHFFQNYFYLYLD
jgi:hypothetical protein